MVLTTWRAVQANIHLRYYYSTLLSEAPRSGPLSLETRVLCALFLT